MPTITKKRAHSVPPSREFATEHDLQCAVVQWAAMQVGKWPALRLLYAVPNGAFFGGEAKTLNSGRKVSMGIIRAQKLRKEGLKSGVPDLVLPIARGGFHGLYLELKNGDKSPLRPEQVEWLDALNAEGHKAVVARSFETAVDLLRWYVAGATTKPE